MIPTQSECDMTNPEERHLWMLKNLPNVQGIGQIVHPSILRAWSKHIDDCGVMHVDELKALADEDGFIHVSQLREQKIKWVTPAMGPRHEFNRGDWMPVDTPEPTPIRLPDINKMSPEANRIMLEQYRRAGMIPDLPPTLDVAEELLLP